jgi:3'-phosphoadenosine 5'-phosphosulfate sulfotransferase (PAPS reductase)/FAD synthetase
MTAGRHAMRDPFKIDGRTAISVSGGRTSGYMLWRVLQANGGRLPHDCVVMFANTGKENEETLRFVREMAARWNVPIHWLEYRSGIEALGVVRSVPDDAPPVTFAEVSFDTASRNGEPFKALIRRRLFLPNPVSRFCTSELKIRTMHRYLKSLGWQDGDGEWDQMVGIRADEQRRVAKIRARGTSTETVRETMSLPLADAGVTLAEVTTFWDAQPFDLELPVINGRTPDGNCDLCFLKPPAVRLSIIRTRPQSPVWWIEAEAEAEAEAGSGSAGARFNKYGQPSYQQLADFARDQRDMFDPDEEALACFCGD